MRRSAWTGRLHSVEFIDADFDPDANARRKASRRRSGDLPKEKKVGRLREAKKGDNTDMGAGGKLRGELAH